MSSRVHLPSASSMTIDSMFATRASILVHQTAPPVTPPSSTSRLPSGMSVPDVIFEPRPLVSVGAIVVSFIFRLSRFQAFERLVRERHQLTPRRLVLGHVRHGVD